jgi:hypothetical protein
MNYTIDVLHEDDDPTCQPLVVATKVIMDDGVLTIGKSLIDDGGEFMVMFDPADWRPCDFMHVPDLALIAPVSDTVVLQFCLGDDPHRVVLKRDKLVHLMTLINAKAQSVMGRLQ